MPDFCLPVQLERLQTQRLKLVPFERNYNDFRATVIERGRDAPQLWAYLGSGPFNDTNDFDAWYSQYIDLPDTQLYGIVLSAGQLSRKRADGIGHDETDIADGTLAGVVALMDVSVHHSSAEIGHLVVFPAYQRTFVASTTNCLLLKHLLDPQPRDLGMRRVQWHANSLNAASVAAAERLGFRREGLLRWHRALIEGKRGELRDGQPLKSAVGDELGAGRHTVVLSLCWDDWEAGGREHVAALLGRS